MLDRSCNPAFIWSVHLFYFSFLRVTKGVCLRAQAHSCSTIHWLGVLRRNTFVRLSFWSDIFFFSLVVFFFQPCFCFCFCFYLYLLLFRRTALCFFCGGFSATCSGVLPNFFFFCYGFWLSAYVQRRSVFAYWDRRSPVEKYFLTELFWFSFKGKTCPSGLGRRSDDVEYLGNIFGLGMRSLGICDCGG